MPKMSHEKDTQLELASTDDLINELVHRFDHAVFCGLRCPIDGRFEMCRRWYGNSLTCNGLANDIGITIIDEFHKNGFDVEDDEK